MRKRLVILVACVCVATLVRERCVAQQAGRWWPSEPSADGAPAPGVVSEAKPAFGEVPAAPRLPAAQPTTAGASTAEDEPEVGRDWMITSPLANVAWPEIKMPRLHWKSGWGGDQGETTGTGPLVRVRSLTQGAARRTRAAWNKTVERLKWRGDEGRPAGDQGFFARMLSPAPSDTGPRTVPEAIAQERPSLSRR